MFNFRNATSTLPSKGCSSFSISEKFGSRKCFVLLSTIHETKTQKPPKESEGVLVGN